MAKSKSQCIPSVFLIRISFCLTGPSSQLKTVVFPKLKIMSVVAQNLFYISVTCRTLSEFEIFKLFFSYPLISALFRADAIGSHCTSSVREVRSPV